MGTRPGLNGMVTVVCVPSGVALTYTETGNSEWLSAFRTDLQAGRFAAQSQPQSQPASQAQAA